MKTRKELLQLLNDVWDIRKRQMNWSGMEDTLVDILKCPELSAEEKVAFAKECIDAYTKRGRFMGEGDYPTVKNKE